MLQVMEQSAHLTRRGFYNIVLGLESFNVTFFAINL